ncbi:Endoribonuclease L-PSP [Gluconacetobacter diazotrophicus PA1 5]|nr:Endoribonuclease L-PSP [Gluconacetobacter diazotrophicus PA1 5]TWB02777.1 enamine deaminase RidA (YjgF/YER057c/UK114 family) [Gluconacetobacter diazotrophicus]
MTMVKTMAGAAALAAVLGVGMASPTRAADIVRYPADHFPIATAIEVPPGASTIYLSGTGAQPVNKSAKPMTLAAYGDTETQVRGALTQIQGQLAKLKLTMGDVVQMHIYMVADPKLGKIDFPGMMKAYTEFFGTKAQPNLPTRSAFEVAHLANPGWLVEIEVTAVRAH